MSNNEIEKFAQWFHQDFSIIHDDIRAGVNQYLESLGENNRKVLSQEIRHLLQEYPGKDKKALKNAWLRLGAQWWNKEIPNILMEISES